MTTRVRPARCACGLGFKTQRDLSLHIFEKATAAFLFDPLRSGDIGHRDDSGGGMSDPLSSIGTLSASRRRRGEER